MYTRRVVTWTGVQPPLGAELMSSPVMDENEHTGGFAEQMKRLRRVAGAGTQIALAEYLGVSQAAVSDAGRRGRIPAEWLVTLLRSRNVDPEWILTGRGRRHVEFPAAGYEDAYAARARTEAEDALRRLPSRALAEELLRRIAVAEAAVSRQREDD